MDIVIGVVAHLKRFSLSHALASQVGAKVLSVDDGHLGAVGNHAVVLGELAKFDADWSVVLQDDAVPVDDFNTQLEMALAAVPDEFDIVSLYLGQMFPPEVQPGIRRSIAAADRQSACWLSGGHRMLHAVGYAARGGTAWKLADQLAGDRLVESPSVDSAITEFAVGNGVKVAYSWPSLVDHADGPTVMADHGDEVPRRPGRIAHRTGSRAIWNGVCIPLS